MGPTRNTFSPLSGGLLSLIEDEKNRLRVVFDPESFCASSSPLSLTGNGKVLIHKRFVSQIPANYLCV
jgi:hypothetical protein